MSMLYWRKGFVQLEGEMVVRRVSKERQNGDEVNLLM